MNILNKVSEIATGWANVVKDELGVLDSQIKAIAEYRLSICDKCEYGGWKCGKCGCPLASKVRSPNSRCPLNKW